jgi:DNA polymerase-3 subunit gamma/tau
MLSSSAFNALLKTLEEPPEHVIFILATTEMHKLPATIISRCQRFDFRRISTTVIRDRLLKIAKAEGIDIDESAAVLIAKQAQGGMRDAISLLELCAGQRDKITEELVSLTIGSVGRQKTVQTVFAIAEKDYETIFSNVSDIVMSSMDIAVFWQDLISVFRDLLVLKTTKNSRDYLDLTDSEFEQLNKVSTLFTKEKILYICTLLDSTLFSMQKSNGIKRIIAEMALVRMCDENLDTSNEALMSRISDLEDRINSGSFTVKQDIIPKKEKISVETNAEKVIEKSVDMPKADEKPKGKEQALRCLAQVSEKIAQESPLVASFLKDCKGYRRDDGKVVLCFGNKFAIQMLDDRTIKTSIATAISSAIKAPLTENDLIFNLTEENACDDTLADFE